MRFGTAEIIILLILALVIFGGSKLSGVGKALGTSIRDFKREMNTDEKENKPEITQTTTEGKDESKNVQD